MRLLAVAVTALALSGCVTLSAEDCRTVDWHKLGYRDGVTGSQSRYEIYVQECAAHGAKVDEARYDQGWREGVAYKRTLRF
jgi:hypothetical protein